MRGRSKIDACFYKRSPVGVDMQHTHGISPLHARILICLTGLWVQPSL